MMKVTLTIKADNKQGQAAADILAALQQHDLTTSEIRGALQTAFDISKMADEIEVTEDL